jgi:ADP-heptose:LPS heptosyltransferase
MSLSREAHRIVCKPAMKAILRRASREPRGSSEAQAFPAHPRKLLLANAGFLGDLVLFRHALGVVKASFPEAEIGLLVAPWGEDVWRGHPWISHLHVIHPFKGHRDGDQLGRLLRYAWNLRYVLDELREPGYEAAIDFRMGFPMFALEMYLAGIPHRLGFLSTPLGSLFTAGFRRPKDRKHESLHHLSLLEATGHPLLSALPWDLPMDKTSSFLRYLDLYGLEPGRYRIFHMSSTRTTKEWPISHWIRLGQSLEARGIRVVFTGHGARDLERITTVLDEVPRSINACGMGGWQGLLYLVKHAEMVYSVDTVTGHLAAALNTPCVSIFGGTEDPLEWGPRGENVQVVHARERCFPCVNARGCPELSCLNGLSTQSVLDSGEDLLGKWRRTG